MLWHQLANNEKNKEMVSEIESKTEACEEAKKELEAAELEKQQIQQESQSLLEKKDREHRTQQSVQKLSALMELNERRKLTLLFNRWNTSSEVLKKETEVTKAKDQQREEVITQLNQQREEAISQLNQEHENTVHSMEDRHKEGMVSVFYGVAYIVKVFCDKFFCKEFVTLALINV